MTEAEWLTSRDPQGMLKWLRRNGTASDRRLRLFACGCCRAVWHLLTVEQTRTAVELAERFADGRADRKELALARGGLPAAARGRLRDAVIDLARSENQPAAVATARAVAWSASWDAVKGLLRADAWNAAGHVVGAIEAVQTLGRAELAGDPNLAVVVRDVFCYRSRSVTVMTSSDDPVMKLAQAVYEERHLPSGHLDRDRLLVLSDMLEERGVTHAELLGHLRSAGPHWRGCWGLDLLLGRS